MKEKIADSLKEKAAGGRITCAEARQLAEELGIPYREVGEAANDLKIKITDCALGCFK